jgi:predicted ATPase
MQLYAAHGRRGAALKQYQVCVAALERELGTEVEPETRHVYEQLLQRPSMVPPSASTALRRRKRKSVLRPDASPGAIGLVGREIELAGLRAALDSAAQGSGRVVAIVGDAGIGKTSLVLALAAEAHARGVRCLLGYSHQSEQVLAFGPWVEALRYGQLTTDADLFESLAPAWHDALSHLAPELTGTRPDAAPSPPDPLRLFESVAGLVRHIAAREPVLVILEDVHWADEMSCRLVAYVARGIRTSRVLVALTMRDAELEATPILRQVLHELHREPHFVQLALSPLTRADTSRLAQSLHSSPSHADLVARLDEQIWRASAGNPFMVVETVRALQQDPPSPDIGEMPLPEPIRRLVAGRLERLSDRARWVAAVAAVIGCQFDIGLLQRAARLDDQTFAGCVEELVRSRVLFGLGEHFDFTHERIRQVAYAELLQPRRTALHAQVATALAELGGCTVVGANNSDGDTGQ